MDLRNKLIYELCNKIYANITIFFYFKLLQHSGLPHPNFSNTAILQR